MKKVIALVMCIAMIACVAVTASAADPIKATLTIDTVEKDAVKVGDVILVNMSIAEKGTRIGALGLKFDYDKDYLKFVMNEDEGKYFVTGDGAGGATAAGNEETMEVQFATSDGFFKADVVLTLAFEVVKEIPAGEMAAVTAEVTVDPTSAEDDPNIDTDDIAYDLTINNGGIKVKAVEDGNGGGNGGNNGGNTGKVETPDEPPVDNKGDNEIPATGDASAIAVAAGLCAVMAAAFVVTKKVND